MIDRGAARLISRGVTDQRVWLLPEGDGCVIYRRGVWLLPEGDGCAVYRDRVRIGEVPAGARAAWAADGERVCWAVKGGVRWRRGGAEGEVKLRRIEVHALALRDEVLFVGGEGRVIGFVDLRAARVKFVAMETPAELQVSHGKAIDAFVFDGDGLIAVDDFLDPKWFLRYDVGEPRRPRYVDMKPLDPHSTGHVVYGAALAERHVAVVATSYNHGRASVRLSLFERRSLHPRARVVAGHGFGRAMEGKEMVHVDACGERLLVCVEGRGLAVVDLLAVDPAPRSAGKFAYDEACSARLEAGLRWLEFPGLAVVRGFLTGDGHALVSLREGSGRHEVRRVALGE